MDIYTGSDNIVFGVNAKPALCQSAGKPTFCNSPPMSRSSMCSVNQYDPNGVYRCPMAAAQAQVSFAVPSCSCAALPDNAQYQKAVAVWVSDMMVQNGLSIGVSVPQGKCSQFNSVSAATAGGASPYSRSPWPALKVLSLRKDVYVLSAVCNVM